MNKTVICGRNYFLKIDVADYRIWSFKEASLSCLEIAYEISGKSSHAQET